MKLFILILILALFLQTTVIPLNIALMLIIARSIWADEKINLYLGFGAGILLGVLSINNVGLLALLFLIYSKLASFLARSILNNAVTSILIIATLSFGSLSVVEHFFLKQDINYTYLVLEIILTLPSYVLVRFLGERFSAKKGIKLGARF